MSKELVKQQSQELISYTPEQISLIKSQIAPKATDDELKLFLYQSQKSGLDPLARQIYAVHRKQGDTERMTIQTSIDGFRVIAERSGSYAGQSKALFTGTVELEYSEKVWENNTQVWKKRKKTVPECAEVTVFKMYNGQRCEAATGVAYWEEYYPGQSQGTMWHKMPRTMLAKCAEAQALRKAFPQDLSGLYTSDEMQQADKPVDVGYAEVIQDQPKQVANSDALKQASQRITQQNHVEEPDLSELQF